MTPRAREIRDRAWQDRAMGHERSLSPDAVAYLASLERVKHVPTSEVERLFAERGHPAPPVWLSFHERFAGYLQRGADTIEWGLAFDRDCWLGAMEVEVELDEGRRRIVCGDAHPSYECWLYDDGDYTGEGIRAVLFEVKLERDALVWRLASRGPRRTWHCAVDSGKLAERLSVVTAATDKYYTTWAAEDVVAFQGHIGDSSTHIYALSTAESRARRLLGLP